MIKVLWNENLFWIDFLKCKKNDHQEPSFRLPFLWPASCLVNCLRIPLLIKSFEKLFSKLWFFVSFMNWTWRRRCWLMKRFSTFHFHLKGVTPLVSIFETEKTCSLKSNVVTLNKFRHASFMYMWTTANDQPTLKPWPKKQWKGVFPNQFWLY